MLETQTMQATPTQQTMRNRTYHCRMRNLYYEKANYQFRKLKKNLDSNSSISELEQLPELYEFRELLQIALNYATASVYYGKREQIASYSLDHHWGILQEETVLVYFLEEQISSVKYIISHIETNRRIQDVAINEKVDIFVSHILESIAELGQSSENDLKYIYENIEKRYYIGNKLFGILQELQNFQ
ncbi:hypothetical protein AGMMS49938_13100 [Fibrobacterales bacterium]|nr:hypothetical protein AGMMS49938_13100 [Fibrobacterales bacterium]